MRGRPCHCIVEYPPFVRQGRIVDCDSIVEKSTNHVLRYIYIYISSSSFLIHQINFLPIFLFRLFDYCLLVQGYSLLRIVIMECKSDQAKRRWLLRKSGERMDEYFFEFWISVLEFEIILWKKKKERKNEKKKKKDEIEKDIYTRNSTIPVRETMDWSERVVQFSRVLRWNFFLVLTATTFTCFARQQLNLYFVSC